MPAASHTAKVTPSRLLREMESLSLPELEKLVPKILALRAKKLPTVLSNKEDGLVKKLQAAAPLKLTKAYQALIEKRRTTGLDLREQQQVEALVAEFDKLNVQRMEWLTELAALRKTTVPLMAKILGLKTPSYV